MIGYEDYVGHRLFEYDESHYVLDEFLAVLTTRLSNGIESYDGVLDHLIYFGVSEIDFYDFMRVYEFTRGYIDYFESLIKSDEGRRILARHMLNDILENAERGYGMIITRLSLVIVIIITSISFRDYMDRYYIYMIESMRTRVCCVVI